MIKILRSLAIFMFVLTLVTFPSAFATESVVSPLPDTPPGFVQKDGMPGPVTHEVVIKATVPLSDVWAEEIQNNSEVFISEESKVGEQVIFGATIKGLDQKRMMDDKVKAEIIKNGEKISELSQTTDEQGIVQFPYVPQEAGKYEVRFVYDQHDRKVTLAQRIYFGMNDRQAMLWKKDRS